MALEALALGYMKDRHRKSDCGCVDAGMDGEAMHIYLMNDGIYGGYKG